MKKLYWIVYKEYYPNINKILKTSYTQYEIDYFTNSFKFIYILLTYKNDKVISYGYMPPVYTKFGEDSLTFINKENYKFKGELSRKSKLEQLKTNSIKDENL